MDFAEAKRRTQEMTALLQQGSPTWSVETMAVELISEVGTLADSIMREERHRPAGNGKRPDLADGVADIIFVLFLIADYYKIDVGAAYDRMLAKTQLKAQNGR